MDKPAVFDSSAVLAVLYREKGWETAIDHMQGALLSTVNLIEVHSKLLLDGLPQEMARHQVLSLGCEICPLDEIQARIASEMALESHPFGLSLGDRVCLALAVERKAIVYTSDQAWKRMPMRVPVTFIR